MIAILEVVHRIAAIAASFSITAAFALADLTGAFVADLDHPAIEYPTRPAADPIAHLNQSIQDAKVQLKFDGPSGYLRSVLEALHIPVESQMLVFSKTSFQAPRINPENPRSLFFNDSVAVGWVRGGDILEIAAEDPRQGVIFYLLDNQPPENPQVEKPQFKRPQFKRNDECLQCHESYSTLGVPGMLMRSVYPGSDGTPMFAAGTFVTDHRSPIEERWGGWYVTGKSGSARNLGNAVYTDPQNPHPHPLGDRFDTAGYLSPYSDVVALLTFEHQVRMVNLLTRVGWEIRYALYEEQHGTVGHDYTLRRLRETSNEIVDYLLFVDEAPLHGVVKGSSGFAEIFAAAGPFDRRGRSLRQFDLKTRLMRYPCSYMIYSLAFDALPAESKVAVSHRLAEILSPENRDVKYARLSRADRQAVLEILRDTKSNLFVN